MKKEIKNNDQPSPKKDVEDDLAAKMEDIDDK